MTLDIRAYAAFTVDAYDHRDFAPTRRTTARTANWRRRSRTGTPQRPTEDRLRAVEPCEFVANPIFSPVIEDNPKTREESWGTSCVYADDNGTLTELLTTGTSGLDDLPPQFADGQALGVAYTHSSPTDEACPIVGANLAEAIASQLE